jgi:hypothetical protein
LKNDFVIELSTAEDKRLLGLLLEITGLWRKPGLWFYDADCEYYYAVGLNRIETMRLEG